YRLVIVFFFSSRRRHTRSKRDWSSDVCSSDLVKNASIPWSNAPVLGQERIGSTLSIAVDPNKSSIVYVGWADKGSKGDIYTLHEIGRASCRERVCVWVVVALDIVRRVGWEWAQ